MKEQIKQFEDVVEYKHQDGSTVKMFNATLTHSRDGCFFIDSEHNGSLKNNIYDMVYVKVNDKIIYKEKELDLKDYNFTSLKMD